MARPSTAVKYLSALPVSWKARTMTIVENTPDSRLTVIGVPQRAEKWPNERGAAPSKPATACERSAPMIQVVPLDSSARMKPIAASVAQHLAHAGQRRGHRAVLGRLDVAAVDGEHGLHRVEEAAEARDLRDRQHEQDGQDRHAVEHHGADRRAQHGERHVALRVLHLVAGRVGQLEADVVEEQHRHGGDEHRAGRLEVAAADAVDAVGGRVDDHGQREPGRAR